MAETVARDVVREVRQGCFLSGIASAGNGLVVGWVLLFFDLLFLLFFSGCFFWVGVAGVTIVVPFCCCFCWFTLFVATVVFIIVLET